MTKQGVVHLYTDGACSGNPGPGGWAAVLLYGQHRKEISGYIPQTTNNRMELLSVIQGLQILNRPCDVEIYSDSAYVVNAFIKGWVASWQRNAWRKADNKPVENQDLWIDLLSSLSPHHVHWNKVAGHQDNVENNRCDFLARQAISDHR